MTNLSIYFDALASVSMSMMVMKALNMTTLYLGATNYGTRKY